MEQAVVFDGCKKTYTIVNPEPYREVVRKYCKHERFTVNGQQVSGISLEWASTVLRNEGYRVPNLRIDRQTMFKALGFGVAAGVNRLNKKCTVVHVLTNKRKEECHEAITA